MRLWLIRHPPLAVAAGICYGWLDLDLAEPAEPTLARIATLLPGIEALVTSPARRCRRVADHLAAATGLDPTIDPRWQELDFGAWEGRPWAEIPRTESDPWALDHWNLAPPGGETYRALAERVAAALATVDRDTAIVTHAGPIRAALAHCLGWPRETLPTVPVPPGSVMGLELKSGGWMRCGP